MFLVGKFHGWLAKRNTEPPLTWVQKYDWPPSAGTWGFEESSHISPTPPPTGSDMLNQIQTTAGTADISNSNGAGFTSTGTSVTLTLVGTVALVHVLFNVESTAWLDCTTRINRDGTEYKTMMRITGTNLIAAKGDMSGHVIFTGLTPGAHTFTLEWAAPANTLQLNLPTTFPTQYARVVTVEDIG